eukprot:scaffold211285_cov46-Attheya_sp.AAC.2
MGKVLKSANKTGDIVFEVDGENILAHRHMLETLAPELAMFATEYASGTTIPIQGVTPWAFHSLLRFVYTNEPPKPDEFGENSASLIDVADRFGCTRLKIIAEQDIIASGISVDSVAELILFADAKNCADLKETAIAFFAAHPTAVKKTPGWEKLKESADILSELMDCFIPPNTDLPKEKKICVRDLRMKLDEKGLDLDGTREMLLRRLEEHE